MRLFAAGTFYLHQSSNLAAEWLCDRDTIAQLRNTGNLLSSVVQLHTMHSDERLYVYDPSVHVECEQVCDWLHASAFNMMWMLDYFDALDSKCHRLFKHEPLTLVFKTVLRSYLDTFDYTDTTSDWLSPPSQAREAYASDVKQYQYRRVKLPFWYESVRTSRAVSRAEPDSYGLPRSLLDLELDLSPLE